MRRINATGANSDRRQTHNGSRCTTRGELHDYGAGMFDPKVACLANGTMNGPPGASRTNGSRTPSTMNLPIRHLCFSGLALNGFTYSRNLSSKFFSILPHGTSSLSVSWSYLALDGLHNPLRAALSSNPTLRRDPSEKRTGRYGLAPFAGKWPHSRWTWTQFDIPG